MEAVKNSLQTCLLGEYPAVDDRKVVSITRISGKNKNWADISQERLAGTPISGNRKSRRRHPPHRKLKRNILFLRIDLWMVQSRNSWKGQQFSVQKTQNKSKSKHGVLTISMREYVENITEIQVPEERRKMINELCTSTEMNIFLWLAGLLNFLGYSVLTQE